MTTTPTPGTGPGPAPGPVIWITGLSGTGKSTLARRVVADLRAAVGHALLIDGDDFRAMHENELGHDRADRLRNAHRIARLSQFVSAQGIPVVVATMSLFSEVHEWNRRQIPGYFEVLLTASIEFLARRDPKGLYARAASGAGAGAGDDVVGAGLAYDLPKSPDLRIEAERQTDPGELASLVLKRAGVGKSKGQPEPRR